MAGPVATNGYSASASSGFQFPSSQNVVIKDHEASGKMIVDFSRKPSSFAVAEYAQIIPAKKITGLYLKMNVQEAGRVMATDGSYNIWPDGAAAREGNESLESFGWYDFLCKRLQFPVPLGDLLVDQAPWDIIEQYVRIETQKCLTERTIRVCGAATTTSNYDSSHFATFSAITGNNGKMDESTTARGDIKRGLNYAAEQIMKDTLAAVDVNDLRLVVSPGWCRKVAQSQEIIDHIKGSPEAYAQVRGELPGKNAIFGMPDKIYGFPLVVEKTYKVTSAKGATDARSSVLSDSAPFMCSRVGGLEGVEGAPNFSTLGIFMHEELTVERLKDETNRRTLVRVVTNYDVQVIASISGFLFQSAVN